MSMPSAQQITPQQDPPNSFPSQLIPLTSPQQPTVDLTPSLQVRNLREQLNAFTSQTSIKYNNQVLFQPTAADNVHIITATDDMVPKARITSWELFLEIQLFLTSQLGNIDANIHNYIPADRLLPTLAQMRRSRPHLDTKVALVESQLAHVCLQVLVTTHATTTLSFHDHQRQYCQVRPAIAMYTSSTILLRHQDMPEKKVRLLSWTHVVADDNFLLTVETIGAEKFQTLAQVQRLVSAASIYFQEPDAKVFLSSLKDESHLIRQLHQNIRSSQDTQAANNQGQRQAVSNVLLNLNVVLNFS
jgi:hypothetical protein